MSPALAFLIFGVAQALIYVVMRRFVQQAVVDRPGPLLRAIVTIVGVVAVAFLVAAGYFAFVGDGR